jgi:hypothetical protein
MKKLFIILLIIFFPSFVFSSEVRMEFNKVNIRSGEEFVVDLVLYPNESINAIEGNLDFDSNYLELSYIRDGNSGVNFWIDKPQKTSQSRIYFSGITPGGFVGKTNIFSAVFVAKKEGLSGLVLNDLKLLKNDGSGSLSSVKIVNSDLFIKKGDSKSREESSYDFYPPEYFNPIISKDPSIFEDKYFVAFYTQDKGSGVSHYEVREFKYKKLSFLSRFTRSGSPYLLKDQSLQSYIEVRSIDNYGNERLAIMPPTYPPVWYESRFILIIIIPVAIFIFVILYRWKRESGKF